MIHVCYAAAVACRLDKDFTWDALLSAVGSLCFSHQLVRGPWSLDLGVAVGHLNGSRSIETKLDCYTYVKCPADARDLLDEDGECHESCGACIACLEAKEVMALDVAC